MSTKDGPMHGEDDLDLGVHPTFERRWRIAEFAIGGCLAVIVVAAALGLAGSGPLASHSQWTPSASIRYPRFGTIRGSQRIELTRTRTASGASVASITLDPRFLGNYRITAVTPKPARWSASPDGVRLAFDGAAPGARVIFDVQSVRFGRLDSAITVGPDTLAVDQFVWP